MNSDGGTCGDSLDTTSRTFEACYEEDGFVGPLEVLSRQEAKVALTEFEKWSKVFPDGKVTGDARFKPHLHLAFCNQIVHNPKLVAVVKRLLKTDNVLLWSSDFNVKDPRTEAWFPPHQDSTYAGLAPSSLCLTVWVALSDVVSEREGCLSFWKGSHKQGQLEHEEKPEDDPNNLLSRGQRLAPRNAGTKFQLADTGNIKTIPLFGGEATIHSFLTVHQSGPNRSPDLPRIGLALRYVAASVKQTGRAREFATLVSGKLQHDGFDLEPVLPLIDPTSEDLRRGREAHAEGMRREAANYFAGTKKSDYDNDD